MAKSKLLYFCSKCKAWRGGWLKCPKCGSKTKGFSAPIKRGGYYYIPGQPGRFGSVTNILGVINKPALVYWAAQQAAEIALENPWMSVKAVATGIYRVKKAAGKRGIDVHDITEKLDKGKKVRKTKAIKGYVEAYQKFLKDIPFRVIETEKVVYSVKHKYAGRSDRLIKLTNNKSEENRRGSYRPLIFMDIKTGKRIYDEVSLQLTAYKSAWNEMYPKRKVKRGFVLLLKDNGTYLWEEQSAPLSVFLAFKKGWEWQQKANGSPVKGRSRSLKTKSKKKHG